LIINQFLIGWKAALIKREESGMGKPKYLPNGKVLERSVARAAEVAKFLLEARARGEYPFGGRHDPAAMFLVAPKQFGISLTTEEAARLTLFWSMVDRGIDSMQFGGKIAYDVITGSLAEVTSWHRTETYPPDQDRFDDSYFDPFSDNYEYRDYQEPKPRNQPLSHFEATVDYLLSCGHPYAGQVAGHWTRSHSRLESDFGGSVLSMVSGSTSNVYKLLRSDFPGLGPKTTPLFLARMFRSGLARHLDLTEIGIAIDRHVLAQTLGFDLLPTITEPVSADAAINASICLWRIVCKEHSLDPAALHEALWLQGIIRCRQVDCQNCPLWGGACRGRVSLALYNGKSRTIDPRAILEPGQLQINFGPEIEPGPPPGPYTRLVALFMGNSQLQLPFFRVPCVPT
jgi:hypothetical protein